MPKSPIKYALSAFPDDAINAGRLESVVERRLREPVQFVETQGAQVFIHFSDGNITPSQKQKLDQIVSKHHAADAGDRGLRKGHSFTAAAGQESTENILLPGEGQLRLIHLWVGPEAQLGDHVSANIRDVDDVLGNGAGALVRSWLDTLSVPPGGWGPGGRTLVFSAGQQLDQGLYLSVVFHSTGSQPVHSCVECEVE